MKKWQRGAGRLKSGVNGWGIIWGFFQREQVFSKGVSGGLGAVGNADFLVDIGYVSPGSTFGNDKLLGYLGILPWAMRRSTSTSRWVKPLGYAGMAWGCDVRLSRIVTVRSIKGRIPSSAVMARASSKSSIVFVRSTGPSPWYKASA